MTYELANKLRASGFEHPWCRNLNDDNCDRSCFPTLFVRPNPYNEHVTFHNFLLKVRNIPGELGGANLFFVEDAAYQKAAVQDKFSGLIWLKLRRLLRSGAKYHPADKRPACLIRRVA